MASQKMKNSIYIIPTLIFSLTLGVIIFIVHSQTNDIISELTLDRALMANRELVSYLEDLEDRAKQWAELI